jgi:hypothetical protein
MKKMTITKLTKEQLKALKGGTPTACSEKRCVDIKCCEGLVCSRGWCMLL